MPIVSDNKKFHCTSSNVQIMFTSNYVTFYFVSSLIESLVPKQSDLLKFWYFDLNFYSNINIHCSKLSLIIF